MWMLLPVFSLAIVHLSGNNVALIPDLAGVLGKDSYLMTIVAYLILGGFVATITAWIGVKSGLDLVSITKKSYGPRGKKILAICLLSISIPASALTGGYYASGILQLIFGIPYWVATFLCLVFFGLLAMEYNHELLKLSNYIALLLLPILSGVCFLVDFQCSPVTLRWSGVNWLLVFALIGYNVGGMWSALLVETAAYLSPKGNKGILLVILAKIVEGSFTLCLGYFVLSAGTQGPLALAKMVGQASGGVLLPVFYVVLFCIFANVMAPAMLVNARQVSSLTGLTFWPALLLAISIVYMVSFFEVSQVLLVMGYSSILMILFISYTAYFLHKYGINQQ